MRINIPVKWLTFGGAEFLSATQQAESLDILFRTFTTKSSKHSILTSVGKIFQILEYLKGICRSICKNRQVSRSPGSGTGEAKAWPCQRVIAVGHVSSVFQLSYKEMELGRESWTSSPCCRNRARSPVRAVGTGGERGSRLNGIRYQHVKAIEKSMQQAADQGMLGQSSYFSHGTSAERAVISGQLGATGCQSCFWA